MTIGAPISIQTTLTPGTILSSENPPAITWTGGDASSVIRVTLIGDITEVPYSYDVYYVSASAGSLTLPSIAGLVTGRNLGELILEVLPASACYGEHLRAWNHAAGPVLTDLPIHFLEASRSMKRPRVKSESQQFQKSFGIESKYRYAQNNCFKALAYPVRRANS